MQDHHNMPLGMYYTATPLGMYTIEHRKVCTTVNQSANMLSKDQGRVDLSTHEGSSDLPLGEKSIETSSTEALANDTSTYVLDTRHDNSIKTSELKRTNDEGRTSAIKEPCTDDEPIISESSQQQSMVSMVLLMDSDSVAQEVAIKELVTNHPICHSGKS